MCEGLARQGRYRNVNRGARLSIIESVEETSDQRGFFLSFVSILLLLAQLSQEGGRRGLMGSRAVDGPNFSNRDLCA